MRSLPIQTKTVSECGRIAILWAQYGPYHFARATALAELVGPCRVVAVELANLTRDYQWTRPAGACDVITLCPNARVEDLSFKVVFQKVRRAFIDLKVQACLLPSYSPRQSTAALLAAKSLGLRTVMMNESHAGTARASGASGFAKRRLVGLFDAALVGGEPHRRYFASLGMPRQRIFTGYDAVDNDYFSRIAAKTRSAASQYRAHYQLPQHFFLNLGRFVQKKNLANLVRAYRLFLQASPLKRTHLVLVGAGEEEKNLRAMARELHLPVYEKSVVKNPRSEDCFDSAEVTVVTAGQSGSTDELPPGLHFYGFRQLDENPVFYSLADAFILPSLFEEWGLVVNEAMASGLPVVVSETAGCAEDLLTSGWPAIPELSSQELHQWIAGFNGSVRRNGFLFKPSSPESLARVLLALEAMPALRHAMGVASRELVEEFSCQNFARNALLAVRASLGEPESSPINQGELVA